MSMTTNSSVTAVSHKAMTPSEMAVMSQPHVQASAYAAIGLALGYDDVEDALAKGVSLSDIVEKLCK